MSLFFGFIELFDVKVQHQVKLFLLGARSRRPVVRYSQSGVRSEGAALSEGARL